MSSLCFMQDRQDKTDYPVITANTSKHINYLTEETKGNTHSSFLCVSVGPYSNSKYSVAPLKTIYLYTTLVYFNNQYC